MSALVTVAAPMLHRELILQAAREAGVNLTLDESRKGVLALAGHSLPVRLTPTGLSITTSRGEGMADRVRRRLSKVERVYHRLEHEKRERDARLLREAESGRRHSASAAARSAERAELRAARARQEARQAAVEARRAAVVEKARRMGYQVKEERVGDTVRLQLVRRAYA